MTINIPDNTGTESIQTVDGIVWTKVVYPSYRNYRSADDTMFIGEQASKFWGLFVRNAAGEFDKRSKRGHFAKPEEAMAFAATLVEEKAA